VDKQVAKILDISPGHIRILGFEFFWQLADSFANNLKLADYRGKSHSILVKMFEVEVVDIRLDSLSRIQDVKQI